MTVRVEHFLKEIMSDSENPTIILGFQISNRSLWRDFRRMILDNRTLLDEAPEGVYKYSSNRFNRNHPKIMLALYEL